jgi:hypothetical protein
VDITIDIVSGRFYTRDNPPPADTTGMVLMPVLEAEPYFAQYASSAASPRERIEEGRYDRSHLSPEKAYRLGRDYMAHSMRYGWPMNVIREHIGVGARILEMGCGKEIPMFRALTCDHSATTHYKPALYVGADLNEIKYRPEVNGCKTVILPRTNIIENPAAVPDEPFDLIVSFEVLEHMDKPDGERFLDALMDYARRKPERENKSSIVLLSTPVNGGSIAKNHIYEWHRSELRRAWEKRGGKIIREFGTFSNLHELLRVLTPAEREVWNSMAAYHSPHTLSCFFSVAHPEAARNIAWHVEVSK